MVGIVGTVGDVDGGTEPDLISWSSKERSQTYDDGRVTVTTASHRLLTDGQPAEAADGTLLWIVGEVYGFDATAVGGGDYDPRPGSIDSAAYCADLYAEHGLDFVAGLNGSFLGIAYDRTAGTVSIFTDRLGSVPLFWTRPYDGDLVFSTSIQAVAASPAVETEFDVGYLHEYVAFKRSFGVKTPLSGIERHPPGAITTLDLESGSERTTTYWRPTYEPIDEPYEFFVDRFVETFRTIMDEWTSDDRSYGVLLSGGSDSRLCLAGLADTDVTAFHMAGWMSREARTAERVALEADVDFAWLRRDRDYQADALERNSPISNFNGWFSQAYATGFETEIVETVDVLTSGMYADTLFKGHAIPSPEVDLGRIGEFELPLEKRIETVDEYVEWLLEGISDELALPTDIRTVLTDNITADDEGVDHHGIRYDSLENMVRYSGWYPLTNDDDMIFRDSLRHLRPYRTPYLDNRLVDLSLRMPRKYQLRRNVVNRALERLSPELARIPHANTGVSPSRSFGVEYLGKVTNAFWRKHVGVERPPKPHLSNGPWVNDSELLRDHEFGREALERNESLVRALPFLEWENVRDVYERHVGGENLIVELYALLTLLEMPLTEQLVYVGRDPKRCHREALESCGSDRSPVLEGRSR